MKDLFAPLLNLIETDDPDYEHRRWNRPILIAISCLFLVLTSLLPLLFPETLAMGAWFPVLVFGSLGLMGMIVGVFGSQKAVARVLGTRRKKR